MKNIVIIPAGDDSVYLNKWLNQKRNFDLFVVYYGNDPQIAKKHKNSSDYFYEYKSLTKLSVIKNGIMAMPFVLEEYDFFFFPDDDIDIEISDVENLFKIASDYGLEICQPGCTGYVNIEKTRKRDDLILRYVNFVEAMMPCFSKNSLKTLISTFEYNKSMWGLEVMWNIMLNHPKNKIAIVDACEGKHTKKTQYNYERFYKNNINPSKDLEDVNTKYLGILKSYGYKDIHDFILSNKYFDKVVK